MLPTLGAAPAVLEGDGGSHSQPLWGPLSGVWCLWGECLHGCELLLRVNPQFSALLQVAQLTSDPRVRAGTAPQFNPLPQRVPGSKECFFSLLFNPKYEG